MDLDKQPQVSRFAPSLTGYLHLGHVLHLLYLVGLQRKLGLKLILRFEDHDRGRDRLDYGSSILQDLEWLGLETLVHSSDSSGDVYRQSNFNSKYDTYLDRLNENLFYCHCSRSKLEEYWAHHSDRKRKYPGFCFKNLKPIPNSKVKLRLEDRVEHYVDWQIKSKKQSGVNLGAITLKDQIDSWSYQYSVVVDDISQGVDFVIRGQDLEESTGVYVYLWRLLTPKPPPMFYHHVLLMSPQGKKLSKRSKDESIGELRRSGWSPQRVFGEVLRSAGWSKCGQRDIGLDKVLKLLSY